MKSTEIIVTKVHVDVTTGEGWGGDEEGPKGALRGVHTVSSLDLVVVIQTFALYFILPKLNMCY